jgi:2-dehydro-3-deoxyphosphooctonate aldolase (KDO 8-P synthase)
MPGGQGDKSGGQRQFVPYMARAAAAIGIDALFMEIHENPDTAPSDGPNMIPLAHLEVVLKQVLSIRTGLEVATPVYQI